MSIQIHLEKLSEEQREKVNKDLRIRMNKGGFSQYLFAFDLTDDDTVILPFAYARNEMGRSRPSARKFAKMDVPFAGQLYDEQQEIYCEAIQQLQQTGSEIISAYPGMGKTLLSIYIACAIRLRTLIIVNTVVLMKQWEASIHQFAPDARVLQVTSKTEKEDADFYIMNAQNVEKKGFDFFSDVGMVIVDEIHLIMAATLCRSLQFLQTRYLLGLSATPYREDELDVLLLHYFGPHSIVRELYHPHTVYRVDTGFVPTMESENGRLKWDTVLASQAADEDRNELILRIIQHYHDRTFLVIMKRKTQGKYLLKRLQEMGTSVDYLWENKQEFDRSCRVLIGMTQKCGTGFDYPPLDTLLLATDVQSYFIQVLARVMRRRDVKPIVFDLMDKNGVLENHYATRKKAYKKAGGMIKRLKAQDIPEL
jgi:superfamily II DNA or RNA helicase